MNISLLLNSLVFSFASILSVIREEKMISLIAIIFSALFFLLSIFIKEDFEEKLSIEFSDKTI
jgi:hypothetical protein